MAFNKLPVEFLDLNEMGTHSRGVSVMYGRRDDGSLVALNVTDDGTLEMTVTGVALSLGTAVGIQDPITGNDVNIVTTIGLPDSMAVTVSGSRNSFYSDAVALTGAFVLQPFGFMSKSITVINDSAAVVDFSFNGLAVHGKLKGFEAAVMDQRAQSGIYLRSSVPGSAYRVWSY